MILEALDGIKAMIDALNLYASTEVGSLLDGNSIAIMSTPGSSEDNLDRSMNTVLYLAINTKHRDQRQAISTNEKINSALTSRHAVLPSGNGWNVDAIDTTTPPHQIGVESDGAYLWASIVSVLIFSTGQSFQQ